MLASFFDSRFGVSLRILAGNPLFRRFWMDESRLSSHDAVYVCAMLKISECCAILTFRALHIGQMSERSKETVLKTVEGQPSASSNLALSAFGLIGFFSKPFFFSKVIDCMCVGNTVLLA